QSFLNWKFFQPKLTNSNQYLNLINSIQKIQHSKNNANLGVTMNRRTKIILTLLLVAQMIGLRVLSYFPEFVEKYYSLGVFPFVSKIFRHIFGWIPFSVGDVFYSAIIILAVRWLYLNLKRIRSKPVGFFLDITATLSIVYFLFNMLWGFNY